MGFVYIKDYDSFTKEDCQILTEGLLDKGSHRLSKAFSKLKEIPLSNGEYLKPADVVKWVNEAISYMRWEWGSFYSFVQNFTIVYIINDPEITTMAVDGHFNMYIDAVFVYNLVHAYSSEGNTEKDKKDAYNKGLALVGAVIMHEVFHIVFNHIERGERWCISKNKQLDERAQHDNNLAADIEVNIALFKKNILDEDRIKKIKALYLRELATNVPPMEEILENEDLMNKLRSMSPFKENRNNGGDGNENNNDDKVVETTSEFDEGYVEMMNKIAELVNKYGPEETINRLREVGAIAPNAKPRLGTDFSTDEVLSMNFLQVKSFDDFIEESNENEEIGEEENKFSTREQGRKAAIQKAIDAINQAMFGGNEGGGGGGHNGPTPKTNIDNSRLTPMNLPNKLKGKGGSVGDAGLPINTTGGGESDKNGNKDKEGKGGDQSGDKKESENQGGGSGSGSGEGGNSGKLADGNGPKSDIEVTYRDRPKGGSKGSGSIESSSVGKTGTFIGKNDEDKFSDVISRTYGKEYANEVKEVIKKNNAINTKETIEKKKNEFYNKVAASHRELREIWDNAKKSEKKYMSMWKKILKKFLNSKMREAGDPIESDMIRWGERRHLSIGQIAPYVPDEYQDPQDINVYIDVSGSVWRNMELIKLMAESLVAFMKTFKYSGINLVAWASSTGEIHKVESLSTKNEASAVKEITTYIEQMGDSLGGGTDIDCCVQGIVNTTFQYKKRDLKDDVHVIITDGEISYPALPTLESDIINRIASESGKDDKKLGKEVAKRCIWILYDNENDSWDNGIRLGELVKISSKNIIPC